MIDFKPISVNDNNLYEEFKEHTNYRGCEYTFANLLLWGEQSIAVKDGVLLRFSYYDGHYAYAFPIGDGDKKSALEAIIEDAKERGIPCTLMGVYDEDISMLESLFPEKFAFIKSRDSFDYVYNINNLADLTGRKYHSKRNHLHRFREAYPNYTVEPIDNHNLHLVNELAENWYNEKLSENPESDFDMERVALKRAFENFSALNMEGLILKNGDEILAFTMGSKMNDTAFDVHFEKALSDTASAYVAINFEFANYIRDKYPEVKYLDREEDMGLLGLRKAKESYRPAYLSEKYRAVLIDESLKPKCPEISDTSKLWKLWQEAFGDSEEFLQTFWDSAFAPNRCRCILSDSEALASLYIFDCLHKGEKIAYIYAVATAKSHRGKGLCHLLMADTHRYLKSKGYTGTVLVPASENLFAFYENMGYKVCTYVNEFEAEAGTDTVTLAQISASEYSLLRKDYLPENALIQENENLRFLETYAKFYKGEDFILTANAENGTLNCIELLGNTDKYAEIIKSLDCTKGRFRTADKEKPFAMYYPLADTLTSIPSYLGFAFD